MDKRGNSRYLGRIVCPAEINYYNHYGSVGCKKAYDSIEKGELSVEDDSYKELKYYMDHGGQFEKPIDFNMRLFYDTVSYLTIFKKVNWEGNAKHEPIYKIKNIAESERIPGDELTYFQAGSFTAFLVEKYSFDTFLELYLSEGDFEEVFGESYDALKMDWMEYLKE